ncbi:hypothetical protein RD110_16945 [Rhodoferax koreense]|uniref:Phosphoribulokinase/uridine kinase domain-containing protein n=1 Tax=Rhodoferax koreensis TaxID=1842727 RepID=A0A1P8JY38_9BURK|nr:hypothetical protein [Rhodoferax koreense]APW38680.1 hypothetical protein RD110_16945 [Rhodoferax koreense]
MDIPSGAPSAAVQRLLALLASGRPRILVGLVGQPGAGKSTVAARWADAVNRQAGAGRMQVLGMDGFHLPRAALARMPDPALALARRGAPWTFDPAGLRQHLQALREGRAVTWPDFQHDIGDPVADAFTVTPDTRLVLVEGLYLLHQGDGWDLQGLFDEVWFLDVPPAQARRQLAERHQRAWGFTPEQAEARIDASDGLNAELVWAGRERADWLAPPV